LSRTKHVRYRDRAFWAWDVALDIFLKYLIDVAEPRSEGTGSEWLECVWQSSS